MTCSKRRTMQWLRTAAENGHADACEKLAAHMYEDAPNAREVRHVDEAAGISTSVGVTTEGHDVPRDVLIGVFLWLRTGSHDPVDKLDMLRRIALEGATYCCNEGCEVVGHRKQFKVCPQCKNARYRVSVMPGRRVSETGLDYGRAHGKVWHIRGLGNVEHIIGSRAVRRGMCYTPST